MIKKKRLKRIFAFLGVIVIIASMALPFGVSALQSNDESINYFDVSAFSLTKEFADYDPAVVVNTITNINTELSILTVESNVSVPNDGFTYWRHGALLKECLPFASVGETYYLSLDVVNNFDNSKASNHIIVGGNCWYDGQPLCLTEDLLNSRVKICGYQTSKQGLSEKPVETYVQIAVTSVPTPSEIQYDYSKNIGAVYDAIKEAGYKQGYEKGYELGMSKGYEIYLKENTFVHSDSLTTVVFVDPKYYSTFLDGYEAREYMYFGKPVVMAQAEYTKYNGYSVDSRFVDFPVVGIPKKLNTVIDNTYCGVLYALELRGGQSVKDLPLTIYDTNASKVNAQPYAVSLSIEVPDGYRVPSYAQKTVYYENGKEQGCYSITKNYTYTELQKAGCFIDVDFEKDFGIDLSTPLLRVSCLFYSTGISVEQIGPYDMAEGKGFSISDPNTTGFYEAGKTAGEQTGYSKGQEQGYKNGYSEGKADGITIGLKDGKLVGFQEGYSAGLKSAKELTFRGLMFAVVDAPVQVFSSMLNFEVLGVNLLGFLTSILTVMIVIAVVKVVV